MSFGRNPHVPKAEAAELKARSARDAAGATMAWREAARQWDRAAEKEKDDKKRRLYEANAETARATADNPPLEEPEADAPEADASSETPSAKPVKPAILN